MQLMKINHRLLVHAVDAPVEVLALVLAMLVELTLEVVHLLLGVLHLLVIAGLLSLLPAKLSIQVGAHRLPPPTSYPAPGSSALPRRSMASARPGRPFALIVASFVGGTILQHLGEGLGHHLRRVGINQRFIVDGNDGIARDTGQQILGPLVGIDGLMAVPLTPPPHPARPLSAP